MTTSDFALPALVPVPELQAADGGAQAARCAADAMLAAAREEAEAIREAARAAGHADGLATATDGIGAAVRALAAAADALGDVTADLPEMLERQAVELAFALAGQVIAGALQARPELVVDVVRGALRRLVDRERVTLLVHPDDLECVRAAAPGLLAELGGIEHCEVQAERRVTRGGAMVRTGEGEVDATLETKLLRAREVIAEHLAPGAP